MNSKVSFRDRPINIDSEGRRKWIYAKKTKGKYTVLRSITAYILLTFLIAAPFIKVNGSPFMLLDISNRKFIIFGVIFWAQDTFILAILMLSFVMFIVVFTVTYGRLWCGWACPQTIFMEMVFRKIENLIEGNYKKRFKRDNGPWNFDKLWRKTLKFIIFALISVLMTNVFLMWFTGPDGLREIIMTPIGEQVGNFLIMLLVSGIFFWIYALFREQICTMVCPYGRMQGVLLDSKSIIVAYDYKRGEPRGTKTEGDCIDCESCVAVCPTGIDIRNGTQMECINCTACIDECNNVMKKINKPKGLIRFDSVKGIEEGHKTVWNTRNRAYTVVLILLLGFFIYMALTRPAVETTILRTPGIIYQVTEEGDISNVYNIKIVNKTHEDKILNLKLLSHENSRIEMAGNDISLKDHGLFESVFVLTLPVDVLSGEKTKVEFGIYEGEQLLETYELTFAGP
jgi:cytochrome c oxidase accessory protein FixG